MKEGKIVQKLTILLILLGILFAGPLGFLLYQSQEGRETLKNGIERMEKVQLELSDIRFSAQQYIIQAEGSGTVNFPKIVQTDEMIRKINEFGKLETGLDKTKKEKLKEHAAALDNSFQALQKSKEGQDSSKFTSSVASDLVQNYNDFLQSWKDLYAESQTIQTNLLHQFEDAQFTHVLILATTLGLGIILLIFTFIALKNSIKNPIRQLLDSIQLIETDKNYVIPDSELKNSPFEMLLKNYSNNVQQKRLSKEFIIKIQEGHYTSQAPDALVMEISTPLGQIQERLKSLTAQLKKTAEELEDLRNKSHQKEEESKKTIARLNQQASALDASLAFAEADLAGKITSVNKMFLQMTGFEPTDLQNQSFKILNSGYHDAEFFKELWTVINRGDIWTGVIRNKKKDNEPIWMKVTILPIRDALGKVNKFMFTGTDISSLKQNEDDNRGALDTALRELENLQKSYVHLLSERDQFRRSFEEQKQIEYRLIQQQSALQELTRNEDIKEGKISESIRSITEATAFTLNHDRAGLWLLIDENTKLRCVDLYDRQNLVHQEGLELYERNFPKFFKAIQEKYILQVDNAIIDQDTKELTDVYLVPYGISSLMCSPIRLGGNVVGIISVENTGKPCVWKPDEASFLTGIGDLISMALEQGNRRVMEEELRTSLEESQALEEELRQNSEEIEATNEELKRAQIELKGQIGALNSAAIVSETNFSGIITYVNDEFLSVYKLTKEEALGKNHRLIKSGEHDSQFFSNIWETITKGKVWKGEIKNRTSDGWYVWMNQTITPVLGADGKPYKFISVAFNISSQKLQEEQLKAALDVALQQEEMLKENTEELLSANEEMRRTQIELIGQVNALNNSSMVYETDMEGNITYVNGELLRNFAYSREDLLGHRYTMLKASSQSEKTLQEQWKTVLNGKIWTGELELKSKDNRNLWVMITNTPVLDSDAEPIKSINVMFDITGQKLQEFRLKRQQAALLELNSNPAIREGDLEKAFQLIANLGMETLQVDRASVWMYEENDEKIRCLAISQNSEHKHGQGTVLQRDLYPIYFKTLEKDRVIAAVDAINDQRTKELGLPLFSPAGIKSILDASIRHGAKPVGIISFEVRSSSRTWTVDEQGFASSLADTVALVLEQRERLKADKLKEAYSRLEEINQEVLRQKMEIEEKSEGLTESIRYAKRIQQNILPNKDQMNTYFDNYFLIFRPRDIVGGDFYWFAQHENKKVVVIADGTGHGVPGAFLTLIGHILLNQIVNEKHILRPADILYNLHIGVRQTLRQDAEESMSRDGMDVALCTFNAETLECEYSGANLPLNYYQDWEVHQVKADKQSIGGEQMEEERTFTHHSIQLRPGDGIYLYTDGFVDQIGGPDGKRFSTRRFRDLILRTQHESLATQRALLNMEWKEWKDESEQLDDVTVFGLRV